MSKPIVLYAGMFLTLCACAATNQPIPDDAMGLSRTSVFVDPAPAAFDYPADQPGAGQTHERTYHTAPPMIPHDVSAFVPITREKNLCIGCHVNPAMLGKEVPKGLPTPVSASHYSDVKTGALDGGHHICTQCHAPQAKVNTLVESTFGKKK